MRESRKILCEVVDFFEKSRTPAGEWSASVQKTCCGEALGLERCRFAVDGCIACGGYVLVGYKQKMICVSSLFYYKSPPCHPHGGLRAITIDSWSGAF